MCIATPCIFPISIYTEYLLPSLHFQSVCVPRSSEFSLLKTVYILYLFLYPFSHLCLLVRAFNSFTFKVVIDMYVSIIIFLIGGFVFVGFFFSHVSHLEKFFSVCCKAEEIFDIP